MSDHLWSAIFSVIVYCFKRHVAYSEVFYNDPLRADFAALYVRHAGPEAGSQCDSISLILIQVKTYLFQSEVDGAIWRRQDNS